MRLERTVLPPLQLPPRSEYAGDHRSSGSRSGKREYQPLPPLTAAKTSPPPPMQPFPLQVRPAGSLPLQPAVPPPPRAAGGTHGNLFTAAGGGTRGNIFATAANAAAPCCTRCNFFFFFFFFFFAAAPGYAAIATGNPDASGAATGCAAAPRTPALESALCSLDLTASTPPPAFTLLALLTDSDAITSRVAHSWPVPCFALLLRHPVPSRFCPPPPPLHLPSFPRADGPGLQRIVMPSGSSLIGRSWLGHEAAAIDRAWSHVLCCC